MGVRNETTWGARRRTDPDAPSPLKILAVEDSASARKVLQGVLMRLGVELQNLRLASDSVEALKVFSQWQPDVVFLDVELRSSGVPPPGGPTPNGHPGAPVDGDELARLLLERSPDLRLVVVTAYDRDHPRVAALVKTGASDVIVKPVLASRVQEVLTALSKTPARPGRGS